MSRLGVLLGNRLYSDLVLWKFQGFVNRMPMSSRLIGTWPQLRGYALFEIRSLISDGKLKPTEWLLSRMPECLKDVTEN